MGETKEERFERYQKMVEEHLKQSNSLTEGIQSLLLMYDEREKLRQNPTPSSAHPKPTTTKPTKRTPAQKFYPPWFQPKPTKSTPTPKIFPSLNQTESLKRNKPSLALEKKFAQSDLGMVVPQPPQSVKNRAAISLEEVHNNVVEEGEKEDVLKIPCTLSLVQNVQSVAREEEVTKSDLGIVVAQLVEPSFNEVHNDVEEQEVEVPKLPCTHSVDEVKTFVCNGPSILRRDEKAEELHVLKTPTQDTLIENAVHKQVHSRGLITCCHVEFLKEQVSMGSIEKEYALLTCYRELHFKPTCCSFFTLSIAIRNADFVLKLPWRIVVCYTIFLKLKPPLEIKAKLKSICDVLVKKELVLDPCTIQKQVESWRGDAAHILLPRTFDRRLMMLTCCHKITCCHEVCKRLRKVRWLLGVNLWIKTYVPTVLFAFNEGEMAREDTKQQARLHPSTRYFDKHSKLPIFHQSNEHSCPHLQPTNSYAHVHDRCKIKGKLEFCNHVLYSVTFLCFILQVHAQEVFKWLIGYLVWIFVMRVLYEYLQQMNVLCLPCEYLQRVRYFCSMIMEELRSILFEEGGNDVIMEEPIVKVPKLIDKLLNLITNYPTNHLHETCSTHILELLTINQNHASISPFLATHILSKSRTQQLTFFMNPTQVHVLFVQLTDSTHAYWFIKSMHNPRKIAHQAASLNTLVHDFCILFHEFSPRLLCSISQAASLILIPRSILQRSITFSFAKSEENKLLTNSKSPIDQQHLHVFIAKSTSC